MTTAALAFRDPAHGRDLRGPQQHAGPLVATDLVEDHHPPHLGRGSREERQADGGDRQTAAHRDGQAATYPQDDDGVDAHHRQRHQSPDLHGRREPQDRADQDGNGRGSGPAAGISARRGEVPDQQQQGQGETEIGEAFAEGGAFDQDGAGEDRVRTAGEGRRQPAQRKQDDQHDHAGQGAHHHPDEPRGFPPRGLTDPAADGAHRSQRHQDPGRMEEQEVPVRQLPVHQADRAGVVHAVVVADHPRQPAAAKDGNEPVRQGDQEDEPDQVRHGRCPRAAADALRHLGHVRRHGHLWVHGPPGWQVAVDAYGSPSDPMAPGVRVHRTRTDRAFGAHGCDVRADRRRGAAQDGGRTATPSSCPTTCPDSPTTSPRPRPRRPCWVRTRRRGRKRWFPGPLYPCQHGLRAVHVSSRVGVDPSLSWTWICCRSWR